MTWTVHTLRPRTAAEIEAQCLAQGVPCRRNYNGLEELTHVGIWNGGWAVYNHMTGIFYGRMPSGLFFKWNDTWCKDMPWFKDLLNFFHRP